MTKRPIMVDTQLLVLLVVGSTDQDLIARHKNTRSSYTRTDFGFLLDLLGYAPKFVFCAHVATEVSNLVAQHGEPGRSSLMGVLKALLNNAAEATIACATALGQSEYAALGLADAAQLALCTPETVLLTDDGPLHRAALARRLTTLRFRDEKLKRRRFLV